MRPSTAASKHKDEMRAIVLSHKGLNPRIIGSVARGEDTDESDIDILIDIEDGASLFDIGAMQYKLQELLGVHVDIVMSTDIPEHLIKKIMSEAVPL